MFSFARDGGYPFSKFLYHINTRSGAPTYCVWISGILAMLLGLLSFAGPLATEAIFTVSIVAQFVSIATPIAARYLGSQEFVPGPFSLGILVRHIISVCFEKLISTILFVEQTISRNFFLMDGIHGHCTSFSGHTADITRNDELLRGYTWWSYVTCAHLLLSASIWWDSLVHGACFYNR